MPPKYNVTILVAEDSSSMRSAMAQFLRQAGFARVITVGDGQEALDHLRSKPYDLIISDWDMPKLTGLELLQAVRADENLKALPFLMTTAKQHRKDIEEAIKAEVSDYIVKPFSANVLVDKTLQLLRNTTARKFKNS